ncbi:MAG: acyltransferase [Ruminococcaceae bacterium]|nr:acyltransferase [Oscillospiraceae bacterium]
MSRSQSNIERPPSQKRIIWLDGVRTVAIACVLLCHSIETVYEMTLDEWRDAGIISRAFRLCGFTVGRFGVPLFLFLTGYLMLGRHFANEKDVSSFYRKRLPPLLTSTLFWTAFTFVFLFLYNDEPPNWDAFWRQMTFLGKPSMSMLWYMPMIIGVYIAIPFLSTALERFSPRALILPMAVCYVTGFFLPLVNLLIKVDGGDTALVGTTLHVGYLGGIYGFYMLLGYIMKQLDLSAVRLRYVVLTLLAAFTLVCLFQNALWKDKYNYGLWYDLPLLPICCVCVFILINQMQPLLQRNRIPDILSSISRIALAVFFIHRPVQLLLWLAVENIPAKKPILAVIIFTASAIISYLLAVLLCKAKLIRKFILGCS